MTKRIQAKYKINRRLGCNLWGRPKSPYNRRESAPGQHGTSRTKLSDFGIQLRAKQRLKGYYGNINEKQFRRYYDKASSFKGDTGENLVNLLEHRLDAVLYRARIVPTVFSARQFISHGHVLIDGKRVTIPSYMLKNGEKLQIREKSRNIPMVLEAMQNQERSIPDYIDADYSEFTACITHDVKLSDIPYPAVMEPNLVIEYYSR